MHRDDNEHPSHSPSAITGPQSIRRTAHLSNNELRRQLGWELIEMARSADEKRIDAPFPGERC